MSDASERKNEMVKASAHLPPLPELVWDDATVAAMRAAYQMRFGEPLPRTETLFAVAAIGYRKALADRQ